MVDLDHFKRINDTMNHLVGSHVIKSVGHLIGRTIHGHPNDYAARYGGDDYIVVLHGDSYDQLTDRAKKICESIAAAEFTFQGYVAKVTCSIGLCFVESGFVGASEDVVKEADAQLYKSKEKGRNQVSSRKLGNSVDLDHVRRSNLVDGNSSSNDHSVARVNNAKGF
jgi:diguanylate cyclase (GGDEF)-like protein